MYNYEIIVKMNNDTTLGTKFYANSQLDIKDVVSIGLDAIYEMALRCNVLEFGVKSLELKSLK